MKENILKFYVNKFYCLNRVDGLDLTFIPPIVKRRMSLLDKLTLSTLSETYTNDIQYVVFSSKYGQADRLLKIISQYKEYKEVSPNTFSASVHNYSASFFLLNRKISIPYTSLSANDKSIEMGLLSSVISNYDNVLYCYTDAYNEQYKSFAINISKIALPKSIEYHLKFESNKIDNDRFESYVDLFSGNNNSLRTPNYTIERIM